MEYVDQSQYVVEVGSSHVDNFRSFVEFACECMHDMDTREVEIITLAVCVEHGPHACHNLKCFLFKRDPIKVFA